MLSAMDPFSDVKKWNAWCVTQQDDNSMTSEAAYAKKARADLSHKLRVWKGARAMRKRHGKA